MSFAILGAVCAGFSDAINDNLNQMRRQASAATFVNAAERVAEGEERYCCFAIEDCCLDGAFTKRELLDWFHSYYYDDGDDFADVTSYFTTHDPDGYSESACDKADAQDREHRVIALCLMAELALDPDQKGPR